jgi:hypothetical protein
MDEEYAQPRDADTDLAEITSRLGEPDATYRTNPRSVVWRFAIGVLIVLAAAAFHYLMWSGTIPWPRGFRHWKLWLIILAGLFVTPALGLYQINFAVRGLKLWVLVYPTGLFVWHRGHVVSFPWDEVMAVQFGGLPEKAVLHLPGPEGTPDAVWFDLSRSRRRVFGTTIKLTRSDGEQISLTSTLDGFAGLGRRVQEETYRRLFPAAWGELHIGRTWTFGAATCDLFSITVGKKAVPWAEVDSLERVGDKLELKRKGKKKTYAKCDLNEVVNLHVLMGIAAAVRMPT